MKPVAVLVTATSEKRVEPFVRSLYESELVGNVILLSSQPCTQRGVVSIVSPHPAAGLAVQQALDYAAAYPYILVVSDPENCSITPADIQNGLEAGQSLGAGLWYADYYTGFRSPSHVHPVCDYQLGSIRDDFDLGPAYFCDAALIRKALDSYGPLGDTRWGGLYELRLKLSCVAPVKKVQGPLFCVHQERHESHFRYVDPRNLAYQKEMETICTEHLRRINALCVHEPLPLPEDPLHYPVEASVIIPVRNREATIADAIRSALTQQTDFPFNVLVVDNHSTDRTSEKIAAAAEGSDRVIRIVPDRTDLGIGGCWNVALQSPACGRYVCQLDSDDLYADSHALAAMIGMLKQGSCGMVVGSYRVVNFNLQEIPPGVVDHREWSDQNGRNNLLRVAGIGAPRAFVTALVRRFPFPNVSYGEDYAVALRISRDYRIGRIYEPLYLCRRWEDNTDARLAPEQTVRYAEFKDKLRTQEIRERQKLNTA